MNPDAEAKCTQVHLAAVKRIGLPDKTSIQVLLIVIVRAIVARSRECLHALTKEERLCGLESASCGQSLKYWELF